MSSPHASSHAAPGVSQAVALQYPFPDLPEAGTVTAVAPGVYWLRMPLPFSLRDDAEALKSLAEQYAAQRTELPDSQHYRLLHRCPAERGHESVWAVIYRKSEFMSEVQIGARLCRADACALAWEHRANPELFEASDDRLQSRT